MPAIGKVRDALKLVRPGEKGTRVLQKIFEGRDVGTYVPGSAL